MRATLSRFLNRPGNCHDQRNRDSERDFKEAMPARDPWRSIPRNEQHNAQGDGGKAVCASDPQEPRYDSAREDADAVDQRCWMKKRWSTASASSRAES